MELKQKMCKACKRVLSIDNFSKSKNIKDGYENKCKKCRQEARKKYNNICQICGSNFMTARKTTKYCSIKCQGLARRSRVKTKCAYCGSDIDVIKSKYNKFEYFYCDKKCQSEHYKIRMVGADNPNYNRVKTYCSGCNKEILVIPSLINNHKYHFCSYDCYRENIGKYFSGKDNPNYKEEVIIKCDCCSKEFKRKPGAVNKNGYNFCSRECYQKYMLIPTGRTYYNHICLECGKEFKTLKKDSKFCTIKCLAKNNSKRFKGEKSPRFNPNLTHEDRIMNRKYPEYRQWRQAVYERDNYTCQCCGDNSGGNLVAHHIYNYSEYKHLRTDINNGITLCKQCHKKFHDTYGYTNNNLDQLNEFLTLNKTNTYKIS